MDALILTAGKGTRLFPITKTIPKPLFPIAGKPLICHILDALNSKINRVILVIGYKAELVQKTISEMEYPFEIKWVVQKEQRGTGHAVKICRQYVTSSHFLMMYGDIFTAKKTINEILALDLLNDQFKGILSGVSVTNPEKYGYFEMKNNLVMKIKEKDPHPTSNVINAGIMILPTTIFDILDETPESSRGEIELTDGINRLIQQNTTFSLHQIRDYWIDIGYPWNILEANEIAMGSIEKISQPKSVLGVTIIGEVQIAKNAILRPGSFIQGPCVISENVTVGPNCHIRPGTYLGKNVRIGNAVEIKNSIILDNTIIGHLSYVGDSIIGKDCNFGAGTKVANLKLDKTDISMVVKGEKLNTGRRKLGVIMGDGVKTGINVSIMPGTIIGEQALIGAHTLVNRNIPAKTLYYYDPEKGLLQKSLF